MASKVFVPFPWEVHNKHYPKKNVLLPTHKMCKKLKRYYKEARKELIASKVNEDGEDEFIRKDDTVFRQWTALSGYVNNAYTELIKKHQDMWEDGEDPPEEEAFFVRSLANINSILDPTDLDPDVSRTGWAERYRMRVLRVAEIVNDWPKCKAFKVKES